MAKKGKLPLKNKTITTFRTIEMLLRNAILQTESIERLLLNNTTTIYLSKEENIITYLEV